MRHLLKVVVLGAAMLGAVPAAADQDYRLTLAASLPIAPQTPSRVIVPAEIDGKPVTVMIDTGSPVSGFTQTTADRLGIKTRHITGDLQLAFPYAGGLARDYARVANFKLGTMTAPHALFIVLPPGPEASDLLLGVDFLHQFDVEFDFAGGTMNLFQPHPCRNKAVYWADDAQISVVGFRLKHDDPHIRIGLTLDGQAIPAILDTGAWNTTLSAEYAKSKFDIDSNTPGVVKGKFYDRYRFKTLSFESVTVENPQVLIARSVVEHVSEPALLGMNVLRRLHLFIAYTEEKLYFTAADAHRPVADH